MIILAIIIRLPPDELAKLIHEMLESLKSGYLLGYLISVVFGGSWFWWNKRLRTLATKEQKRLGDEKNELQKPAGLGAKVRSSRK